MDSKVQIMFPRNRKGTILIWVVALLPVILLFALMAVDFSYMYVAKGQLQNAADAAALAGAQRLIRDDNLAPTPADMAAASNVAAAFALANKAATQSVVIDKTNDITFGNWNVHYCQQYDGSGTALPGASCSGSVNAIQVRAARDPSSAGGEVSIIFGKYFRRDKMSAVARATAAIPVRSTGPITMCYQFCEASATYPAIKTYSPPLVLDATQSGIPKCSDTQPDACMTKFAWTSYYSNVTASSGLEKLVCNQNLISQPTCGSKIYATMGNDVPPLRALEAQMYNPSFDSDNKDFVADGLNTIGWWLIVPITLTCPPGAEGGGSDPHEVSKYAKVHILYIYSSGAGKPSLPCLDKSAPSDVKGKIETKYGISIPNNSIVIDKVSCADCSSGAFFSGLRPVLVSE